MTHDSNSAHSNPDPEEEEPVPIPITGELDLHTFPPRVVKELVPDYLAACREKGIYQVRIIHGKGTGQLQRTVHAVLNRLPEVAAYSLAGEHSGSWGATIVNLRKPGPEKPPSTPES